MSSVVRAPAQVKDVRVWSPIMSPTYHDDVTDHTVLIPFTCENGVLDINIQDGSQAMIDSGDLYNETGFSWRMVRQMGGERLVTSLGPNFLTWLDNYLEGSDYQLVIPPTMTKVQQHVTSGAGNYGGSMLNSNYVIRYTDVISGVPAPTDNYVFDGNNGNNFYTAWVFKTPLTISYNDGGDPYYMTFQTMFQRPN